MVAIPEDLSSRESSSLMTTVREAFAKSVSVLWRLTLAGDLVFERLHIGTAPTEFISLVSPFIQEMRNLVARPLAFLRGLIW